MESEIRRAWVEVDLGALTRNAAALAARAGVPLLAVIKADAYGLGAPRVARALESLEPWGYGVATVAEGVCLRDAGITRPILVLSPLLVDEFEEARRARLRPSLGSREAIRRWVNGAGAWHLQIDTGMNRAGIGWRDVGAIANVAGLSPPEGAFTHFHSADLDDGSMEEQERRFRAAIGALAARPAILHVENSPAIARRTGSAWDLVRPGVFLFGVGSGPGAAIEPEPVVHLRARIVEVRTIGEGESVSYAATWCASGPRRIATAAIGYADGYRRSLGNRAQALVRGHRVPVAGLVTMDMVMLDVTDVPCEVGDVATLLGRDGAELIDLGELSSFCDLSPYELLIGLRLRVPHIHRDHVS